MNETVILLNRIDQAYHFEAINPQGNTIELDAAADIGGSNKGFRPMETLLAAIASCSVFDMILILNKQRQNLLDVKIKVSGWKENTVPSPWKKIHMHFVFYGKLNTEKVGKAVHRGVEKYCSVGKMLEKSAEITYSYEIIDV